jgi:hypothetical protein
MPHNKSPAYHRSSLGSSLAQSIWDVGDTVEIREGFHLTILSTSMFYTNIHLQS